MPAHSRAQVQNSLMENAIRSFSARDHPPWTSNVPSTGDTIQEKQKETLVSVNGTPSQRKRKRTLYSKWQQLELERVFEVIPYPDINTREQLAKIIRLPESKVQVWFQNRRARKNKSGKLDKSLYRKGPSFLSSMSPSPNHNQRDPLAAMTFPPNQSEHYRHDGQQVPGIPQSGFPSHLQTPPPISQQNLAEGMYHCAYEQQESQWQNLTQNGMNGYSCQATVYGSQFMDLEQCTAPSLGSSYWDYFPHTVNGNGSQTSLGNISDVIYNAAILTNVGDF
ncbi:homeobox protein SEBOX [Pyxicephalus adspersus]|uniref:homeobox protein SEBOX n=1 Tax=Pyxicephalus adspersus TaxID=30357 RepID=UPI003B5B3989